MYIIKTVIGKVITIVYKNSEVIFVFCITQSFL